MTNEEMKYKAEAFDRLYAEIRDLHPNPSHAEPVMKVYLLGYKAVNKILKAWLTGPSFNGDIERIAKHLPAPKDMLPEPPFPSCISDAVESFKSRLRGAAMNEQHLRDEGYVTGKAVCLGCSHEWKCAIEPGTDACALECPKCRNQNSVFTQA